MRLEIDLRDVGATPPGESSLLAGAARCAENPRTTCRVLALPAAIGDVAEAIGVAARRHGATREEADSPWTWENGSTMAVTTAMPDQGEHPGYDPLPTDDE